MPENEQELLKLETEIYHSDGGIYFADCDTASTRDDIAQQLENRFINKDIKIIKVNIGVGEIASTRDEIARHLENVSSSKDARRSEIGIRANDLAYTLNRYRGDDAAFFVYPPSEKSELEELARILNYTREEFAKIKQPIIIWVDKVSLGVFARYAPDFWAWRARVSEFRSVSEGLGYGGEVEVAETIWRGKISDEEIQSYERALAEFQERGDEREVAKTLGQLGILYYRRYEWDRAIEYCKKSMETFEDLDDHHGLAATYNNLGLVYTHNGKWDRAIEYYEKNMEISEALGDQHGLAQTYNNLGAVYTYKGEWDRAIEYCEKGMEISEALGDQHGIALTYGNLGNVYTRRGEWDRAIDYHEKDMEISEALGDQHGLAQTYNNLGVAYTYKGEWDRAIDYHKKRMEISEALGDQHGLAQTYNNLGLVYANTGEWDRAIEYYEKSMEIKKTLGDQHGAGTTLANIGKTYLDQSDPTSAKRNLEEAIKNIRPDARPYYPHTLDWLAVSLRMIADQKKREAKLASGTDREKLVSYSVRNVTERDADKAIALLDSAITEMKAALEFADGADAIRIEGAITSHKAKRCVREIWLYREDAKRRDRLLDKAIDYLGEASKSFGSLGETGACSSKTCDGCRHLYTALGLIRDGYREESNQKIMDAVSEIRLADECYQSISNELGTDVVDRVNEILRRVADNLKNVEGFDPRGAVDAANNVFDALDEIAEVGLRNMIRILVFDEAGNVTERELSTTGSSGGDSARDGGVILSGTIGDNATINIDTGNEPPSERRKSVSLWDCVLGAIGAIVTGVITAILMSLYFEEPIKNFRIPAGVICVIMLLIIIYMRYRISNSNT
jgi:tetratricopeptide (TPR) repeat protein